MEEKPQSSGPFQLRLPDGMRDKLKARAAANRRSMNSEILVCLERAVSAAEGASDGDKV